MGDPRHSLGHQVEETAARWLESAGWIVLGRRVRSPTGGEVDIVALDPDRVLVALEVRARRSGRTGSATESVDRRHIERMRRTLAAVSSSAPPHAGLRIDLVAAEPMDASAATWRLRRTPGIEAW
jgi:putative endonuclease